MYATTSVKSDTYVDNVFLTAWDTASTLAICKRAKQIFCETSMEHGQFVSNSIDVINERTEEEKITASRLCNLAWNVSDDQNSITFNDFGEQTLNKRILLNFTIAVDDPSGLISSATLLLEESVGNITLRNLQRLPLTILTLFAALRDETFIAPFGNSVSYCVLPILIVGIFK
ncbi:unnamed protein product [Toxocara canis]|uniref:Transmembrane protein n=1 Tax=Toxocara canis TaxID=6265 RepID=A0A183UN06_TOXCA|nr:unnamed protein product [Toxocara canis]